MNVDSKKYTLFNYEQTPSKDDKFILGDIVIKESEDGIEIGVIIQCQGNDDYRTDMFGNCNKSEIKKASLLNVIMNRPSLFNK